MNAGLRAERFRAQISDQDVAAGRFVPARTSTRSSACRAGSTGRRASASSYDLFGNARTALKGTINRYMAGQTLSYAQRYNPLRLQFETRPWRDANRDDIAQDIEIGPSNNAAFGLPVFATPAGSRGARPRIRHRNEPGHSARAVPRPVGFGFVVPPLASQRAAVRQPPRRLQRLCAGRRPQPARRPGVYGLQPRPNPSGPRSTRSTPTPPTATLRSRIYNGYELGMSGRMRGAQFFGGLDVRSAGRQPVRFRRQSELLHRRDVAYLGWCDQKALDIPFRHEFKLSGSYTLPVRHPGERGVPELCGPDAWNILGHQLDDHLRRGDRLHGGQLRGTVRAGSARDPEPPDRIRGPQRR